MNRAKLLTSPIPHLCQPLFCQPQPRMRKEPRSGKELISTSDDVPRSGIKPANRLHNGLGLAQTHSNFGDLSGITRLTKLSPTKSRILPLATVGQRFTRIQR